MFCVFVLTTLALLQEKGGFFSGILQTTDETPAQVRNVFLLLNRKLENYYYSLFLCGSHWFLQDVLGVPGELSASNDSLSDNGNKKVRRRTGRCLHLVDAKTYNKCFLSERACLLVSASGQRRNIQRDV